MKKIGFLALLFLALSAQAQDKEKTPAARNVVYGKVSPESKAVSPDELKNKLVNDRYEGQVKGTVVEVCKAEGCWVRLKKADGTSLMVRAKDHAFLMPENIVGKTVLVEGAATVKEVSEEMRKHYAEDAGKPRSEIAAIKGPEKEIQFSARGVKVLD